MENSNFFVACGYQKGRVLAEMRKVPSITQEESLRARERGTTNRIPLHGNDIQPAYHIYCGDS